MMEGLKKIYFRKIRPLLKRLPLWLARNAFSTFLIFFVFSLLLGAFILNKYYFSIKKKAVPPPTDTFQFETETYQKVLQVWQEKEKRLEGAELKDYPRLFTPPES